MTNGGIVLTRRHVTEHVLGAIFERAFVNRPSVENDDERREHVKRERRRVEPGWVLFHLDGDESGAARSLLQELLVQRRIVRKVATEHFLRVVDVISNARFICAVHHSVHATDVHQLVKRRVRRLRGESIRAHHRVRISQVRQVDVSHKPIAALGENLRERILALLFTLKLGVLARLRGELLL